jgi:hypothetical protein
LILGLAVVITVGISLIAMHPDAIFCGLIISGIFLTPMVVGVVAGVILRAILKGSSFSQRFHFPLLFFLLLPLGIDQLQKYFMPPPVAESVQTAVVLPFGRAQSWENWMFYEDVKRPRPWLLRFGLPQPLGTRGRIHKVGDTKTCLYVHGRLVKQATALDPGHRIAFNVIEQTHVEDHAVRLISGSFDFETVDATHTRVTLTTDYIPLLTPRFCWRPIETICLHTLHRQVLEGMCDQLGPYGPPLAEGPR